MPPATWATVFLGFLGGGASYIRSPQTGELLGLIPQGADWLVIGGLRPMPGPAA
jgi:hypothetical protein